MSETQGINVAKSDVKMNLYSSRRSAQRNGFNLQETLDERSEGSEGFTRCIKVCPSGTLTLARRFTQHRVPPEDLLTMGTALRLLSGGVQDVLEARTIR